MWNSILNQKVVAFRGITKYDITPLSFILFEDQKTFIKLDEHNQYDYHDFSTSSRILDLYQDTKLWKIMFEKSHGFNEPTNLIYPF